MEINDKKLKSVEFSSQRIIKNNVSIPQKTKEQEDTVNVKNVDEVEKIDNSKKVSELKDKFARGESLEYDSFKVAEAIIKETATIH